MKKTYPILACIVIAFCISGISPLFTLLQFKIKKNINTYVKHSVKEHELIVFANLDTGLNVCWYEDQEFSYQGNMYDIQRVEIKNGIKYYYCINDSKENQLNKTIADHTEHSTNNPNQLLQLFFLVMLPLHTYHITTYFEQADQSYTSHYCCLYHSSFIEIMSPPPKGIA